MKSRAILLALLVLTACSNANGIADRLDRATIHPPDVPATASVQGRAAEIAKLLTAADGSTLTSQQYVEAGYDLATDRCNVFFQNLTDARRTFDYIRKESALAISATSAMLALLKNTAQTLAIMAVAGSLVTESISNTEDFILLTRFTDQLEVIVVTQQRVYKQVNKPELAQTPATAVDFVKGYARLCTVDQLEIDIAQALNNSEPATPASPPQPVSDRIAAYLMTRFSLDTTPTGDQMSAIAGILASGNDQRRGQMPADPVVKKIYDASVNPSDGTLTPAGLQAWAVLSPIFQGSGVGSALNLQLVPKKS